MTADVLREAATEIRRDTFNGQTEDAPFMEAVADWLDAAVARWEFGWELGETPELDPAALVVARAYLGSAS